MLTPFPFLPHPHCLPHVLSVLLSYLFRRLHRIEPALSAQPGCPFAAQSALFALPAFRGGKNAGWRRVVQPKAAALRVAGAGARPDARSPWPPFGYMARWIQNRERRRHTPAAGVLAMRRTGLAVASPGVWGERGEYFSFLCLLRLVK